MTQVFQVETIRASQNTAGLVCSAKCLWSQHWLGWCWMGAEWWVLRWWRMWTGEHWTILDFVLMERVQSCPIGLNQFFQWWSSSCCISWKIVDIASFLHPTSSDPNHGDVRASSTLCSTENPKVGPAGDLHHGWLPHIWQNIWLGMHMIALVAGYTIGKEDIRISRLKSISTASKQVRTSIEAGFDSFTSRQEWKTLGKLGSKLLYFCCMFHVSSGLGSLAWRKWRRGGFLKSDSPEGIVHFWTLVVWR